MVKISILVTSIFSGASHCPTYHVDNCVLSFFNHALDEPLPMDVDELIDHCFYDANHSHFLVHHDGDVTHPLSSSYPVQET
jgi:hypothetical protein